MFRLHDWECSAHPHDRNSLRIFTTLQVHLPPFKPGLSVITMDPGTGLNKDLACIRLQKGELYYLITGWMIGENIHMATHEELKLLYTRHKLKKKHHNKVYIIAKEHAK